VTERFFSLEGQAPYVNTVNQEGKDLQRKYLRQETMDVSKIHFNLHTQPEVAKALKRDDKIEKVEADSDKENEMIRVNRIPLCRHES